VSDKYDTDYAKGLHKTQGVTSEKKRRPDYARGLDREECESQSQP
jgi:hypothetical protein